MAYKKEELEAQALEAITKHMLYTIEDVVSFLPCTKPTFYAKKLNESAAIKEAILNVKRNTNAKLRRMWLTDPGVTGAERIALYKLGASQDELDALTVNKNVNENNNTTAPPPVDWIDDE